MSNPATGIHRAVFGAVSEDDVDDWLDRHVRRRLTAGVQEVVFRTGRLAAVYGLRLTGGDQVVAKVHRDGVNLGRLSAAVACQRILADAGYPCPRPLDGPVDAGSRVVVLESWLDTGEIGNGHEAAFRRTMARSLVEQVELLRAVPAATSLLADPPAWLVYEAGPWPVPHDPIFDFAVTPPGYEWLDRLARDAAGALGPRREPEVIAHADWYCGNLRFTGSELSAAWDWDSLTAHQEPVLAGAAAGSYTDAGAAGAAAPAPGEVTAFLDAYDKRRAVPFTGPERAAASAAALWVMAYNARCQVAMLALGHAPGDGSYLWRLSREGDGYCQLLRSPRG
jgi:Phosphotransferase enzyme family